jgi:hypothetical protein
MTIIFQKVKSITHCEINTELSEIVAHNFRQLGMSISIARWRQFKYLGINQWDWIYIDPSRRNDAKGKSFMLKDCLPMFLIIWNTILKIPMLYY